TGGRKSTRSSRLVSPRWLAQYGARPTSLRGLSAPGWAGGPYRSRLEAKPCAKAEQDRLGNQRDAELLVHAVAHAAREADRPGAPAPAVVHEREAVPAGDSDRPAAIALADPGTLDQPRRRELDLSAVRGIARHVLDARDHAILERARRDAVGL